MAKAEGVSILDGMVAETLATVGEKPKRTITPLAGERGADTPLPQTDAPFPNDVPTEVVAQKVAELTRIINHLSEARDALQSLIGLQAEVPVADVTKQKERAADAAAAKRAEVDEAMNDAHGYSPERFRELQKQAQDATFIKPAVDVGKTGDGWHCPTHPDATPLDDRSPKGREFRRCTVDGCKQFER